MRILRLIRHRLRSLLRARAADAELERELAWHLEALTRENMAAGMTEREARLAARRTMGNPSVFAEECRDRRGLNWLTDLRKDVAYAMRMLRKSPGFTALAVLALALGCGGGIAVFTLGEALLLRSLPYPDPERLVGLSCVHVRRGEAGAGQEEFRDWRAWNTVFEHLAITEFSQMSLTGLGEPERVTGRSVSPEFFELLGVHPTLGRWFTPEECKPGADRAVMLSQALWRRKLGGRPDIIGESITFDGRPYRIAGVMPERFRFNEGSVVEYWTPIAYVSHGRMQHQYDAYGLLRPGVAVRDAQTQMKQIAQRLEKLYPETNSGWTVRVIGLRSAVLQEIGPSLLVFAAAVGIVLLVACGNVASLLLARGTGRAKEIAVRLALGAGRARIVRMLLAESLLLSCFGTAAGLLLAYWLVRLAISVAPAWIALESSVAVSAPLVSFVALLTFATALLTGIWPAVKCARNDVQQDLKEGGTALVAGAASERALGGLVVAEVALAVVLLTFAGLLVSSFAHLVRTDLGFRADRLLTFRVPLPRSSYGSATVRLQFFERLLQRLAALPGVVSAASADAIPLGGAYSSVEMEIEGAPNAGDWADRSAGNRSVTPDYFRTMGVRLLAGRAFTASDRADTERVIIVGETFVRKFLPNHNPLGQMVRLGGGKPQRIVGVVSDLRHDGPSSDMWPETYTPLAQNPWAQFVVIRTALPEAQLIGAVRAEVRSLDRDLPITQVRTMTEAVAKSTALPRQMMALVSAFAAVAALMATLGLSGVMAYDVSRRKREIGLRMALGGRRGDISLAVLRKAAVLVAAGSLIGVCSGLAGGRLIESVLYGVRPGDPAVLAAAPFVLAAVALIACLAPARRAASIDPMSALRLE